MKKISILFGFACIFLIDGCDNKVIPLKNIYQDKPYEFTTSYNKEQTWDKIIDLFTAQGLAIKTIDKVDGVITTDNTSFLNSYTWENSDGSFTNSSAFVVCSKFRGPFTLGTSFAPTAIAGQWAVRIKPKSDKTVVNLKLANATGKIGSGDTDLHGNVTAIATYNLQVKSTGIFEKLVENTLK